MGVTYTCLEDGRGVGCVGTGKGLFLGSQHGDGQVLMHTSAARLLVKLVFLPELAWLTYTLGKVLSKATTGGQAALGRFSYVTVADC